jgi:hypothetical protein
MTATTGRGAVTGGAEYPTLPQIVPDHSAQTCGTPSLLPVGRGEAELEEYISSCRFLMERAHARFLASGNPADRDEAVMWMFRRQDAMRARSQSAQDRMHAEIDRAIAASAQSRGHL